MRANSSYGPRGSRGRVKKSALLYGMEERIARFADIDTRRAMGIYGRVKIPCIKIHIPIFQVHNSYSSVNFDLEKHISLTWDTGSCLWFFGSNNIYSLNRVSMKCWTWITGKIPHPDFNSDASFKRAAKAANDGISSL